MTFRLSAGRCCTLILAMSLFAGFVQAGDWSRFRGPNGSGVSEDRAATPVTWSETQNVKWKVDLPGPGSSSPIVVKDRVFVTCWSGYATERGGSGDLEQLKRHLMCFDRATGKVLWNAAVPAKLPEENYRGMFAQHGYASHTPVSDGESVFVFFGKSGVLAFDWNGKQLWQTLVGNESDRRGWGTASSPILYKNLVIVTASAESEALVALDKSTGKQVWRQEARGFASTWGTPVLVPVNNERTDLVLGVPYEIWGFNPDTGKLAWFCAAMNTDSYCSSVVAESGVVYGIEGMGGGSIAVRAGGTDDVTKSHVVWTDRHNNRIGTPAIHDGRIYFISRRVANCIDAKTGERIYQSRLEGPTDAPVAEAPRPGGFGERNGPGGVGGQDYASPIIADGKLYYQGRFGELYVVKVGPTFEQLAVNRLTSEREDFSATPAVSNGDLFIRSSKRLYCVSSGKSQ